VSANELRREVEELRASRARVLAASDAHRRSVERALHDRTIQDLAALSANLQLATRFVDSDAAAARRVLEEMVEHVHEALADVRQLAWSLYPSLLAGSGIAEALRTSASHIGISTRVEAAESVTLPPDVQMAVYFACVGLLQHAAADARSATVRVNAADAPTLFEMTIDGPDAERWAMLDLYPIHDRLAAFGRRLVVLPAPAPAHGVRVHALVADRSSSAR
jgi:signal transduction histidine kinase